MAFFGSSEGSLCRETSERFLSLPGEVARLQQAPAVVNFHPAAGPLEIPRDELLERSVRFFGWAVSWAQSHAPGARPVAGLQIRPDPGEPVQRLGDTYDELLRIVGRSGVDACWDFGHAAMNAWRFALPLDPLRVLRRRLGHVHCHDVDREDHRPLLHGTVPWQRWLCEQLGAGYRGTVLLEVAPRAFLRAGGTDTLVRSVRALQSVAGAAKVGRKTASRGEASPAADAE